MATKGIKGFDISGLKEVYKNLDITEDEIIKAAKKGQKLLAQNILGESQKLVPVDTGTLQRSGHVTVVNDINNTTIISYDTPYARKQHEDTTLNHPRGGEAKYLERPFNKKAGEFENFVSTEVYKVLRKKYPS